MADADNYKALRKAFPKESVGKLPKAGMQLDYVGHAAVTDRLLEVDPTWTWEPLGTTEAGLPALDDEGNLWIKLTVLGVTRLGVGDGRSMKERIGDALRNAAMRFGVALDLWSKEELESIHNGDTEPNEKPASKPQASMGTSQREPSEKQLGLIRSLSKRLGIDEAIIDTRMTLLSTSAEASEAIDKLNAALEKKEEE
jgi:hypothetical protein